MLIIGLRSEEDVLITCPTGEVMRVRLLEAGHGRARLGFTGPGDVRVRRVRRDQAHALPGPLVPPGARIADDDGEP